MTNNCKPLNNRYAALMSVSIAIAVDFCHNLCEVYIKLYHSYRLMKLFVNRRTHTGTVIALKIVNRSANKTQYSVRRPFVISNN